MTETVRVLHVDDDPDLAELAATYLEREEDRFTVETATSATAGLRRLAEADVDCVVSDYDMPGTNGIEFLESVRTDYPDLPFILFTGKGSEEVASEAVAAGATDYLQKETGTDQYTVLANRIENSVSQYRAERRASEQERVLELLRDINKALVGASTRDEIAKGVTTVLADAESYALAWIGDYDDDTDRIIPQTAAGIENESLEPVSLSGTTEPGAIATAIKSGKPTVTGRHDPTLGVWSDGTPPVQYESTAVIPVTYHGDCLAVLAVYAKRADTIDEMERRMLVELAGDLGQALHTAEIHRTLRRHQTAVEVVPEGVFILDADGTVILANDHAASLSDRSVDDVCGESFLTFVEAGVFDEEIVEWYLESVREMLSSANDRDEAWYETTIQPPDGPSRTVEIHLTLRPYDDEFRGTVGVIRDVTGRKQRERTLRRKERQFEAVFEDPHMLVGILDCDGTLRHANRTAMAFVDATLEAVTGEPFWETPWWTDETRDDVRNWVNRAAEGEYVEFTADHVRPDGDPHHVEGTIRPVVDDQGEIHSLIASARDITERREREQRLERKNERLEEFADIVSHDLRNPLQVAEGRLELVRDDCDSEHLEMMATAHSRMETLIEDLLTLARESDVQTDLEAVELAEAVDRCWRTVETAEATLVVDTECTILADRNRLRQLLENLVRNAVEHGGTGVTVTVGESADGFYVADDGPGIPEERRDRIFERGYSTADDGPGFGLAIVREIADAHDWNVRITDSTVGGARFELAGVETVE